MMSFTQSWRRRAAAVGLVLAATAGVLAVKTTLPGADAQAPASETETFVLSNLVVTANTNGFVVLGVGEIDGILGFACTGASPLSGGGIPGDVITELRADTTVVRILRPNATPVTGDVGINCVVEAFLIEGEAAIEELREAADAG